MTTKNVRSDRLINATVRGVPLSIIDTPEGPKAYVRVCPHDWVVMRRPFLAGECLVCPVHSVEFNKCSGEVTERRGKRITEGLRQVGLEVRSGEVHVRMSGGVYVYLAMAHLRRIGRVLSKTVGRRRRVRLW